MGFAPIAVVGRGCVLPDALDPQAFWSNIVTRRLSIAAAPPDRWRLPAHWAMGAPSGQPDRTGSDAGGYVTGFESVFDPQGFALRAEQIRQLDPLCQWVLYGVRQALAEAGRHGSQPRAGLVMGNLSFPSAAMAQYAEDVWLQAQPARVRNTLALRVRRNGTGPQARFSSGLPAHLAAAALELGAGAFALDAACASALYAVKLACDRLHDGTAELMVAGAVNCPDDLFIHMGFSALSALSPSGRSRPFHRHADGLVPAEGAAFVALMRLQDALATGTPVHGVIRGIGLSNDGRAGGLLSPDATGQERAMRLAYQAAGIAPETVSLLECHATGTPVGDTVEVASTARTFSACPDLPIGSAKSNVGHLITAAGAAGLLKVLGAMNAGIRPPTLGADQDELAPAIAGTPLRVLTEAEPWTGPRRAAVSAFGFGGNNAHLIVDAWDQDSGAAVALPVPDRKPRQNPGPPDVGPVAIVAIGARVADGRDAHDFRRTLLRGTPRPAKPRESVDVDLAGLRFPPVDLDQTLPQQLLVLEAAREAAEGIKLPRERTAVLIGMGCDPEVARFGARWRVAAWLEDAGVAQPERVKEFRDAFTQPLTAAGVLGTMPNIVANRVNAQLDLAGPSFALSAEQSSGIVALQVAARAIRAGEIDAALVGAVDMSHEPVHRRALESLAPGEEPGDGAIVLVLKPLVHARRDGDEVIALLDDDPPEVPDIVVGDRLAADIDPAALFGRPHAANGLIAVAAAAIALHHQAVPRVGAPADPSFGARSAEAVVSTLHAAPASVRLRAADGATAPWLDEAPPRLHVYSGADAPGALTALAIGRESHEGPARLVILAANQTQRLDRSEAARRWLTDGGPQPEGVAFRAQPIGGEVAFVFSGGSMAYPGMGRELMLAFPDALTQVERRCTPLKEVAGWAYMGFDPGPRHVLEQIWGASLLGQVHAGITRDLLGLRPGSVLGYSSGETNALLAMGVWTDADQLVADARQSALFTSELVGEITAVRRVWERGGVSGQRWASYLVSAPVEQVRAATAGEPAVHIMTINSPESSVVGGEAAACERVVRSLAPAAAIPIGYDIAVHAPELEEVRAQWRQLHHRDVTPLPGVRFYTGADANSYHPDRDSAADALTGQALGCIDFAAMTRQAWDDGARVFIEHGPRSLCTGWIQRTLHDREHVAVALDSTDGRNVRQLTRAVAELVAAGVPMDHDALFAFLAASAPPRRAPGPLRSLPAHPPEVHLPDLKEEPVDTPTTTPRVSSAADARPDTAAIMQPAPAVPTVNGPALAPAPDGGHTVQAATAPGLIGQVNRAPAKPTAPPPTDEAVNPGPTGHPGPKFDRADLEYLADGDISTLFGQRFAAQRDNALQTRMPQPPMLLVDRVTGIDAEPASMRTGRIWTQTDVTDDSWYLDACGRMPAGLMIEAGQADLLLISWLGIDLLNRGTRVYRLLGCDLTFHGSPARAGETLDYEISVDGHGSLGDMRLFFFHYDCHVDGMPRVSVRNGQAGFFTDDELANTGGVIWDPSAEQPPPDARVDEPQALPAARRFDAPALRAFADGRPADCFGAGWERTRCHVRSPRIGDNRMLLLDEVTEFDVAGGPWGRGYLRAQTAVGPDDWFFSGHFKNDPCMPGTLMFEGCLQAMSFYLAAAGFTIERDGWRFEPVPDQTYRLQCRGQVTPASTQIVYEIFVSELDGGDSPTLFADVLVTVDGVRAFHAKRVGLRLVPDWPLAHWGQLGAHIEQRTGTALPAAALGGLSGYQEPKPVARNDGFAYDYASLLAYAWGKPSEAFGHPYQIFDGARRVARLPGPPYHFVSRIASVNGPMGGMQVGSSVEAEYDVPDEVWYFEQNGRPVMPLAVMMEVALQPCGWLAGYIGSALTSDVDLLFRNLDGSGAVTGEITPGTRVIRTRSELTSVSRAGTMIIEAFEVECFADETPIFKFTTTFGYFPPEAFQDQVGIAPSAKERAELEASCDRTVDLREQPAQYCAGTLRLPGPMLLMLDRVDYWPQAGESGLGRLRGTKRVDPGEWFFKAHFFQDPVQPGSLGVEAITQLLQFYLIEQGAGQGMAKPGFESVAVGRPLVWKYRGQVVPTDGVIRTELEILEVGDDGRGRYAVARGWLWVDDKRIYQVPEIAIRVVDHGAGERPPTSSEQVLEPAADDWLLDHRPTWTVPTLPMMSTVDRLAHAAAAHTGKPVTALRDVTLRRWIPVPAPLRLRTQATGDGDRCLVELSTWREARTAALSRFDTAAGATVHVGAAPGPRPAPFAPVEDGEPADDPYAGGSLFHGPAFQYLVDHRIGASGASGILDCGRGSVPVGLLNQGLLDAATHVIPHDELCRWSPEISREVVGYPQRISALDLFETLPEHGEIRVEARFAGFDGDDRLHPAFDIQLVVGGRVAVAMRLVDVLLPKGRVGSADPQRRRRFLRDREYADGLGLSSTRAGVTELHAVDVQRFDWLPGTVAHTYRLPSGTHVGDHLAEIAVRDHVGRQARVHPSRVDIDGRTGTAQVADRRFPVLVEQTADGVVVRDAG